MNTLILLSSLGLSALLAEIFNFRKLLFPLVIIGLPVAIGLAIADWNYPSIAPVFKGMLRFDHYAILFSTLMTATLLLWLIMSKGYFKESTHVTDHFALVLFALIGAVVMVSFSNMTMLFIGIEILSLAMYVLAGSKKSDLASNESAFKYFLMGSFATGFLLFGIALVYGATGSFDIPAIANAISTKAITNMALLNSGIILILVGLGFKISAVPFHFWAPDVYQGAPTVVTAFMATIVKTAAFAAFYRLFAACFIFDTALWANIVWVMAALTMLLGNITAIYQNSVKRMLAYSSISHAGYMLLAILALSTTSSGAILFYTVAYSFASIAAFTVLIHIANSRGTDLIDGFNGLAKSNPGLAFATTVALLSLAGIPPTAGFFAKYYIFNAAINKGFTGIVIVAVISSLISVYYYFRIIIAMYFRTSTESVGAKLTAAEILVLIITTSVILILGLLPDAIISLL
jgi:NADH-quinone oxidoreductase subunit N